jgi:hypothetical protein
MVWIWRGFADHAGPSSIGDELGYQCDKVLRDRSKHQDLPSIGQGSICLLVEMISLTLQASTQKKLLQHSSNFVPSQCDQKTLARRSEV